jgi:hypothetical protein
MLLLVSGATATVKRYLSNPHVGLFVTPRSRNDIRWMASTGKVFAADNGAYAGFDPAAFCSLLAKLAGHRDCRFVACPDVVGNARETAYMFAAWQPVIKQLGLPVALVLQDGIENLGVPWSQIDALFIGGSTAFKLGPVAASIAREGKQRGLWVHCGCVNTRRRFRYAADIGCDSVDGTAFSNWPEIKIPKALRWLNDLDRQPSLALAA